MKKRAVAIVEGKEGYDWSWTRDERIVYHIRVEKLKGNHEFKKIKSIYKNGTGFEGVGGAEYTIYKVKLYKNFVGRVIQVTKYTYSKGEEQEILFDNVNEKKEQMLQEYLKAIEAAEKLNKKITCQLTIYFDSELFKLRDFFEFVKKLQEKYTIYPIKIEKNFQDLGLDYKRWQYKIYCESNHFILRYNNSYYGKEAYKKVNEILKEYEDLLRKK
jgi:hypothetical protein